VSTSVGPKHPRYRPTNSYRNRVILSDATYPIREVIRIQFIMIALSEP